jgi:ssDNA-binding Zn-finger/Zn-ribbon topoisomerase 1
MRITFDKLMNELGCRDSVERHLALENIPCPSCGTVMGSKVYDNAGRPMFSVGGPCGLIKFAIAGREFWACFEKVQCPGCSRKFLHRFTTKLWCEECETDVRMGMNMFDTHYICGQSHHASCWKHFESGVSSIALKTGAEI